MGERGIVIDFEPEIGEAILEKILAVQVFLQKNLSEERVEIRNTYHSLLIHFFFGIQNLSETISQIKNLLLEFVANQKMRNKIFYIPVCYHEQFGLDLGFLSKEKGLSIQEITELHSAPVYTVYFIGFLPGFLYLGGLKEQLHISRKDEPRLEVQKGTVAIGEKQTGIYPQASPGGWQLIGNSPVPVFQKDKNPPCEVNPGDKLKFYPVSLKEHKTICKDVEKGIFKIEKEEYGG